MRIIPIALIAAGVFGLLKHYGFIDPAFMHLLWPVLLIGLGVALLVRGPRWRAGTGGHLQGRWERRMHRHFGPGWANLSEEERERFRAGMQQWRFPGARGADSQSSPFQGTGSPAQPPASPAPGEQR